MSIKNKLGSGIGIGLLIGSIIGIITDNIALWISLGIVFGAGVGHRFNKNELQEKNDNSSKQEDQ